MKKYGFKLKFIAIIAIFTCFNQFIQAQPGTIDPSFNVGNGAMPIYVMKIQNDGKIVIGGCFRSYNLYPIHHIARINIDGSRDTSFHSGFDSLNVSVTALAIQNDGKIVIGGYFKSYYGIPINNSDYNVARLNPNGSLDTSFHFNLIFTDTVFNNIKNIFIQSDGKILVSGYLFPYQDIIRLNTDGKLDTTFSFMNICYSMLMQNDDKILFSYCNNYINRSNCNGSIDTTFIQGVGADSDINNMCIQNDGKILVCGNFTKYNGIQNNRIVRLNTNGILDSSFKADIRINNNVEFIVCESNGKIIISLDSIYNTGVCFSKVLRLNTDGSLDSTFYAGVCKNDCINNMLVQPDDKILITGFFYTYNGQPVNNIVRINGGAIYIPENNLNHGISVFPNPTSGNIFIQCDNECKLTYEIYDMTGRILMKGISNRNSATIDLSNAETGVYILHCNDYKMKIIKQ